MNFLDINIVNKFKIEYIHIDTNGLNEFEILIGEFIKNNISFEKFIPKSCINEEIDVDKLIKTTFSKGLTEQQRKNKENTLLPHYEKINKNETITPTDFDYINDEEQDEDDDLDV